MELWIRSQDKMKLVKVNYLYIMDRQDHFTIFGETIDSGPVVGTYKSKERALEVLDEIQNILKPKLKIVQTDDMSLPIMNGEWVNSIREKMEFDTIQLSTYVYEMPKE